MSQFKLEELLTRKEIPLERKLFEKSIQRESILVTGASGSIGSALVQWLCKFQIEKLICLDQSEIGLFDLERKFNEKNNIHFVLASIRDKARLDSVFENFKPSIVFHVAAYKHVSFLENQIYESFQTNVLGTHILSKLAISHNVKKFVHVSTDKSVNPKSIMGATKRIAELIVSNRDNNGITDFCIARFGNVLGTSGSIVTTVKKMIQEGGKILITDKNATRFYMTKQEACLLILYSGIFGKKNSTYIFDMGTAIRVEDLVRNIFKNMGERFSDWKIEITGLRNGEKLKEELIHDFEYLLDTEIDVIKEIKMHQKEAMNCINLEELSQIKNVVDENHIRVFIKQVLPNFKRSI